MKIQINQYNNGVYWASIKFQEHDLYYEDFTIFDTQKGITKMLQFLGYKSPINFLDPPSCSKKYKSLQH